MPKKNKKNKKNQEISKKNKSASKKFSITIIKERCKGCKLCIIYCPTETLEITEELNYNGYFVPRVIDIKSCKGCNLCSKICPDFAIFCTKIEK